jgi:hypothetical protein
MARVMTWLALALAFAGLVATPAAAASLSVPLTGAGAYGGGSAPVIPYTPLGVMIDPPTFLIANGALGVTDTKTLFMSWWDQGDYAAANITSFQNGGTPIISDPIKPLATATSIVGNASLTTIVTATFTQGYWFVGETLTWTGGSGKIASAPGGNQGGTYTVTSTYNASTSGAVTASGTQCETTGGVNWAPGVCFSYDNNASFKGQFNLNDSVGVSTSDAVKFQCNATNTCFGAAGPWHHHILTFDAHSGAYAYTLDGVNGAPTPLVTAAFISDVLINFNQGGGLGILNAYPGPYTFMGVSELIIDNANSFACTGAGAPTTMAGIAVTCAGAHTVPPEIIARVYAAGAPVNPGTNCANVLGYQPSILCMIGDATTFPVNAAAATNPFALSWNPNQVSATGSTFILMSAAYGPAGIPAHQPTMRWPPQATNNAPVPSNVMTTNANGEPITAGDLIVIDASTINASILPGQVNCPTGGSITWTQWSIADSTGKANHTVCAGLAVTGDLGGAWALSCNNGNLCGTRANSWVLMDYQQVNQTTPIDTAASGTTAQTTGTAHASASLTTANAGETLVTIFNNSQARSTTVTPPNVAGVQTGMGRFRWQNPLSGNFAEAYVVDQYGVALGANTSRTFTSAPSGPASVFTLAINPG